MSILVKVCGHGLDCYLLETEEGNPFARTHICTHVFVTQGLCRLPTDKPPIMPNRISGSPIHLLVPAGHCSSNGHGQFSPAHENIHSRQLSS